MCEQKLLAFPVIAFRCLHDVRPCSNKKKSHKYHRDGRFSHSSTNKSWPFLSIIVNGHINPPVSVDRASPSQYSHKQILKCLGVGSLTYLCSSLPNNGAAMEVLQLSLLSSEAVTFSLEFLVPMCVFIPHYFQFSFTFISFYNDVECIKNFSSIFPFTPRILFLAILFCLLTVVIQNQSVPLVSNEFQDL